jgi:hypothetical protein
MRRMYRANLIWPVLIIGVGTVMLLISADVIPEAIGDVLVRSWPVLLIIFGLNVLIGQRIRYANWFVLGLGVAMVVIIANFAYAERAGEYREDYRESRLDILPPEITSAEVFVDVRETRVTISAAPDERMVDVRFTGSNESSVTIDVTLEGTTAFIRITEKRPGVLPRLEEVGRGTLNLFLPTGVTLTNLNYVGDDGSVTADLSNFSLESINMHIKRGNMKLCLPLTGNLIQDQVRIDNGDLRVIVPPDTPLRFASGDESLQPVYEPPQTSGDYQVLVGGVLETRLTQNFRVILNMNVDGDLILDHRTGCE